MKRGAAWVALFCCIATFSGRADELSGADKLRVVYSNQFAWTRDGLPMVTVRLLERRSEVTIGGAGVRVLPDGEGGAEVQGGATWTVRLRNGRPSKRRWHVVVARLPPSSDALKTELQRWRERGFSPRSFEIGALFAIKGEVLDSRRALVAVAPSDDEAEAQKHAAELHSRFNVSTSLHPEIVERATGTIEAASDRGASVRNESILWFSPGPSGLIELRDVDLGPSGAVGGAERSGSRGSGGREARRYYGKLYVTVDDAGQLAVVNAVPEDKLLAGLLPAEIGAGAPPEALKAQAVAARNELLAKIGTRHLGEPYRLCSTTHCQVYAGAGREDPRATAAVLETRGQLLVHDGSGELVDAVYSASCGGHSEDNDRAWGGSADQALRGKLDGDTGVATALARFGRVADADVRDFLALGPGNGAEQPWCAHPAEALANYRWHKPLDLDAVAAHAGVGRLRAIEVLERGVSGRAVSLRFSGDSGEKEVRGELDIRRALGNLKSALFVLDVERDGSGHLVSANAVGGGHGHGIGMCQTGAIGMALAGKTYVEILRHYYSNAHLRRLY